MNGTKPSSYIYCDKTKNGSRLHLAFCQNRCKDYPCKQAEQAEMNLMTAELPYKFNEKGEPTNGTISIESGGNAHQEKA